MVKVKLIAYSKPIAEGVAKHLPVLAFKVSTGKLHDHSLEYYLSDKYPKEKVKRILLSSVEFPSILEHITFTFIVEDISRVCSHQLVRHRLASFTQESQRYSESYMKRLVERIVKAYLGKELKLQQGSSIPLRHNYLKIGIDELRKMYEHKRYSDIIEVFLNQSSLKYSSGESIRVCYDMRNDYKKVLLEAVNEAFVLPESIKDEDKICLAEDLLRTVQRYYELVSSGVKYEDARFVIPQAVKTRLMVTVNLRELLHMACLRLSPKAQWEIRKVVELMIEEIEEIIPEVKELVELYCKAYGAR